LENKKGRLKPPAIATLMTTIDADERKTSMGLFNTAEAWRLSAIALQSAKVDSGFAEHPLRYLHFFALELYLKALLRQKHSVATLQRNSGTTPSGSCRRRKRSGSSLRKRTLNCFR
jgi:hypothetical protein